MVNKIYAVRIGKTPGKYYSWDECRAQVDKFPNSKYKSFKTETEADEYLSSVPGKKDKKSGLKKEVKIEENACVAYVDGSYNSTLNTYGYGIVFLDGVKERQYYGTGTDTEAAKMENVAGEILAAQKAVAIAMDEGFSKITICHDYTGTAEWTREWKTNNEHTKGYKEFMSNKSAYIDIIFHKVEGHSGDRYNNIADRLARKGAGI